MSQQINLLLPELRPRLDLLSFAVVAPATLAAVALVAVNAFWQRADQRTLTDQESKISGQLKAAQDRMLAAAKANGERKGDPALAKEAERLAASLQWRRDALQLLQAGSLGETVGFSPVMAGLARQSMEGLWLTAFKAGNGEFELQGRLLDPALLPVYIRRLNGESAFQGRRFAELAMQGVTAEDEPKGSGSSAPAPKPAMQGPPRYTEFSLRTTAATSKPGALP